MEGLKGLGFRAWGLGFSVQGLGFRVFQGDEGSRYPTWSFQGLCGGLLGYLNPPIFCKELAIRTVGV